MQHVLIANQLSKVFPPKKRGGDSFVAVDAATFALTQGEILGLLGPNGAGKSTTISMLLGVLTPTSGSIEYFGRDFAASRNQVLQHVTFASTYIKLPWRLTVAENLRVYGYLYGLSAQQFYTRMKKFLQFFGVWEQRDKTMNELSAGQITRVMLAKAFIPHPKIVLLDEPTASLDPDIAHEVRAFVLEQQREYGASILYTSHNMDEVTEVCDRVLFLRGGKIVADDTPARLAQSISGARMILTVADGMKRIQRFAREQGLAAEVVGREVSLTIDEQAVAGFLTQLAGEKIAYTHIAIEKPTLEDYFLQMSKSPSASSKPKRKEYT